MLCWGQGGEKHEASLVPGCMRSDTSKVQEAEGPSPDVDSTLGEGCAQTKEYPGRQQKLLMSLEIWCGKKDEKS